MSEQQLADLLEQVVPIAEAAGDAIMAIYLDESRDAWISDKEDRSPLTEADLAAHHVIVEGLEQLGLGFPILSEESKSIPYEERKDWETFWLVDPLDGTKEFLKRNGEFTVNIALIHRGEPVLGVVVAPALGVTYGAAEGLGAWLDDGERMQIRAKEYKGGTLRVVASRSHAGPDTEALIQQLRDEIGEVELVSIGSSLKLCLVAAGKAHLYPRLGLTSEWDVAAAHAVVNGAGATLTDVDGNPFRYNKENILNPFFIVSAPGAPGVA
ncbi:MAG: 3'(2'),5'-bisphosphate nucleotidase CysQ [Fimbriimonas sp.]